MVNLPKSMTGSDKEKQYDRKMLEEKYQKPLGGIKYTQAGLHFLNEKKNCFFHSFGDQFWGLPYARQMLNLSATSLAGLPLFLGRFEYVELKLLQIAI